MSRYLIRRILGAIVVMWAVATLVFFMLRAVPGDPIAAMLFDVGDPGRRRRRSARSSGSISRSGCNTSSGSASMLQGDLGTSLLGSRIEVSRIVAEAFPRTISLATPLVPDRDRDRGAGRADLGAAAPLGPRPYGHLRRVPRAFHAGFLGRDPADHPVRRQSAMAAGDRLCAARPRASGPGSRT